MIVRNDKTIGLGEEKYTINRMQQKMASLSMSQKMKKRYVMHTYFLISDILSLKPTKEDR